VHLREGETAEGVLARLDRYTGVCAFLVEAWSPLGGGSGLQADWQLAAAIIGQTPRLVLLAGGLTPNSVARALTLTNAHGVDVSSGVERDGWKDPDLIQEFVRAARSITRRVSTNSDLSP
jgi:phosphoribosylanthranilate isomerase